MALRLFTGSKNIGRNKGNGHAKLAITPHRHSKAMVEQVRKETIGSWEELTKQLRATSSRHINGQHP
jgi:hypothetical protein